MKIKLKIFSFLHTSKPQKNPPGCILLSAIFLFALVFLVAFNKGYKAVDKMVKEASNIPQIWESVQRSVKFGLTPSVRVENDPKRSARELSNIHSSLPKAPLQVSSVNSRYFTDSRGRAVYLTGVHTWSNLQDSGRTVPPLKFDYTAYLDFLKENNLNFIRLWAWESPGPWIQTDDIYYWFYPMPYQRLGSSRTQDGEPKFKFDLSHFNQTYFDRLRQRVQAARDRGIYVSIMFFNGWSVDRRKGSNPWQNHPFNQANNINGINGDQNSNNSGEELHTLTSSTVTNLQEAYIRKVIDTVNDLDNVLYEISNESPKGSHDWQYHMISYIKSYEGGKLKQHPVGMTAEYPDEENSRLFTSPADWISPRRARSIHNPLTADGNKVILSDTDHLCGLCGDSQWVWKSFTRGENPIFMDPYDNFFIFSSIVPPTDAFKNSLPNSLDYEPWIILRRNLGYTLTYANRMNLMAMTPRNDLASTGYCLANPSPDKAEYLVYSPTGGSLTVDLSQALGELAIEWFNPTTGLVTNGITTIGGGNRLFVPPFGGDAVLYIQSKIS